MEQIGYSLVDVNNIEINFWGNTPGQCQGIPKLIIMPNGDHVHNPVVGETLSNNYRLVERHLENNPPSVWHSKINETITFDEIDNRTVITYVYSEQPDIVPQTVTPLQMRKALRQLGLRDQVEDFVKTLDADAQDSWEYAIQIERNNQILIQGAIVLGKTEQELDEVFRLASTLS